MNENLNEEQVEMLDFDYNNEDTEVLDLNISEKIDEMLDFIETPQNNLKTDNNIEELVNDLQPEESKVELNLNEEKLNEYKPSIRDFNIKSAKTRKIVYKSMLYVIIIMLFGFEFFISKTGETLDNLRVYASDNNPIRIVQNNKYGYIDYKGKKLVNPKYTYAENFVGGYAIVKDSSNLPMIIDKGGKEIVPTGNYFSVYRVENDIVASKVTKKGLKYGVLDSNLKEKVPFIYNSISYTGDVFTYTKDNTVGLINKNGKEIYKYKLTDLENKTIDVAVSTVTNDKYERYAVVKVNSSSQIININDGSVVSGATLNEIVPEENNVFYEVNKSGNKRYMYVQNNKILLESDSYISLKMPSVSSGVLKAITTSYSYEFISTKTMEQVKKGILEKKTYYGDNVFLYDDHDYKSNKDYKVMVKNGETFKTLDNNFQIVETFTNGISIVKFNDGYYGYLDDNGEFITETKFIEANAFDSYGEAIAKTENGYGVINKNGKVIIKFENNEIKMASSEVKKKSLVNKNNVFYAVKKDNKFALYNAKGKRVNKKYYEDIIFDDKYPLIKAATDMEDVIIATESLSKTNLTSFNSEYEAFDNYIIIKNEYYNYKGNLIYVDNSKAKE